MQQVPREEEEANREAEKTEAQVPREEESKKEVEKTEAKARPRFDPLAVPRLLPRLLWRSLRTSSGPRDLMK